MRQAATFLGTRTIGDGQPCFVLADLGSAHGGHAETALKMLECAFQMGADGIKLQIFRTEKLLVRRHPSRKDFERIELGEKEWRKVLRAARGSGLSVVVEPLDAASLALAEEEGADAYEVHVSDMDDPELIRSIGARRRPVLFPTIAAESALREALELIGDGPVGLLHGPLTVPAPVEEIRFRDLGWWKDRHHVPVGFRDQSDGGSAFALVAPALAAAWGADFVEKRFTLDRSERGPDYQAALSPEDFYRMVELLRQSERARGDGLTVQREATSSTQQPPGRMVVAGALIPRGEVLTAEMLAYKRTDGRGAAGFSPREAHRVIGRRAARPIQADEPIREEMLE